MSVETPSVNLPGIVNNGQQVQWPAAVYPRTASELDIFCLTAPSTGDAQFQLTLNGVGQPGIYVILNNQLVGENMVAPNVTIPANSVPGLLVVQANGIQDVTAYLSLLDSLPTKATRILSLFMPGGILAGAEFQWPRTDYSQQAVELDLLAQGAAPGLGAATFQLTLDGSTQTNITYTIPQNATTGENSILNGLGVTIPANVFPGIIIINPNGAQDVVAWLTLTVANTSPQTTPWVTPTVADLRARMTDQEYDAFESDVLQQESGDSVPALLSELVDEVRSFVHRGGYQMGLEGSIPRELLNKTVILVKYRLFDKARTMKMFADGMKDEQKMVNAFLEEKVAHGLASVSVPVALAIQSMQGAAQVQSFGHRQLFSRRRQDGLT